MNTEEVVLSHRLRRSVRAALAVAVLAVAIPASAVAMTPAPGGGGSASPPLPSPHGGYGSYHQSHSMGGGFEGWTNREIMHALNRHFSRYFPFSGCGVHLWLGKVCRLHSLGLRAPVKVVALTRHGFAFRSLGGHPEGAGRTITFRFFRVHVVPDYFYLDQTYLEVDAWGPVSKLSWLGPLNSDTVANHYWGAFANHMRDRMPACPRGKHWTGNRLGCARHGRGTVPV